MDDKRKQWLRLSNRLMSGALAMLGLASCSGEGGEDPMICMYGTPSATYHVKGKVVDAETGVPVPGIQIVTSAVHRGNGKEWIYEPDTLHTDADGAFSTLRKGEFPTDKYRFIWEDTDGAANGVYAKDSTDVKVTGEYINGGDWYKGEATIEATLKIKK